MTFNITSARWNTTPGLLRPQHAKVLRKPDAPQEERQDSKKERNRDQAAQEEAERVQAGTYPGKKPGGFSIVV